MKDRTKHSSDTASGLLWVALTLAVAGNVVAQFASLGLVVHLVCGVVAVASVAGLIANHMRKR
ncbi:hypothetical protein [Actinocrispum wychmicini]|uniref:Uncharacterized protein n=1 Tax=Actinocrispum wychmicini TaxID=1213861 RepID=A0A4R2J8D1_9PSEU|nr:hypothetical protein [Actinocrispum wychmicini]TCO54874.1 hypothetical protein EV192_108162 [Actinocrispum wychmicini]